MLALDYGSQRSKSITESLWLVLSVTQEGEKVRKKTWLQKLSYFPLKKIKYSQKSTTDFNLYLLGHQASCHPILNKNSDDKGEERIMFSQVLGICISGLKDFLSSTSLNTFQIK